MKQTPTAEDWIILRLLRVIGETDWTGPLLMRRSDYIEAYRHLCRKLGTTTVNNMVHELNKESYRP